MISLLMLFFFFFLEFWEHLEYFRRKGHIYLFCEILTAKHVLKNRLPLLELTIGFKYQRGVDLQGFKSGKTEKATS